MIAPTPNHRPALVTIRLDDDTPAIPAYVHARTWNGYQVPLFPADTFTAHADAWRALFPPGDVNGDGSLIATYAADGTLSLTASDGETTWEDVERTTINGIDYFAVGSGAYVWELA